MPDNATATSSTTSEQVHGATLTDADQYLYDHIPKAYADGKALLAWWEETNARDAYANKFQLDRQYTVPGSNFGFLDTVTLNGVDVKVFGDVQEQLYDQPKSPERLERAAAEWTRAQLREYVLRYFLHISASYEVEPMPQRVGPRKDPPLAFLSACLKDRDPAEGIGFMHVAHKLKDGEVWWLPEEAQTASLNVTEIGTKYDWVLAKAKLFQFSLTLYPFGPVFPLTFGDPNEHVYCLFTPYFVTDHEQPRAGVLGEYGFGFSLVQNLSSLAPVTVGPQTFDLGFQFFKFRILENGEIWTKMVFMANQLTHLLALSVNPLVWGLRTAELASLELAPKLFQPLQDVIDRLPFGDTKVDVVFDSIRLLNLASLGLASRDYCVSIETVQKDVLLKHDAVFYEMIANSSKIWRQIPNWLDAAAIPAWARFGSRV